MSPHHPTAPENRLSTRNPSHPHRARRALPALALLLTGLLALAPPSGAQSLRPWMPSATDSLANQASQALTLFRAQTSDTITAENFRAYEIVGRMARDLVRSLGRARFGQATAIEAVLDSFGLETAVRVDPEMPSFVLVSIRNPERASAFAMGFFFWFRGNVLHQQGSQLPSGRDPKLRVWYGARPDRPYSLCILDRGVDGRIDWVLYGLSASGDMFSVVQAMGRAGEQGRGQGAFVDADGDGRPELTLWTRGRVDTVFTICPECPGPIDETLLSERAEGFLPEDVRALPTPFSTFALFVRFLQEGHRANAARLLEDPKRLDEAIALGWGARRGPGSWAYEYAQPGERWPDWIAMRFNDAKRQLYVVRFAQKAGRRVIRDWTPVKPASESGKPGAPAPAPGTRP